MKKAKIMLSAIGVLAIVGGALAFKAHKGANVSYYLCTTTIPGGSNVCVLKCCIPGTAITEINSPRHDVTVSPAALTHDGDYSGFPACTNKCDKTIYYNISEE